MGELETYCNTKEMGWLGIEGSILLHTCNICKYGLAYLHLPWSLDISYLLQIHMATSSHGLDSFAHLVMIWDINGLASNPTHHAYY